MKNLLRLTALVCVSLLASCASSKDAAAPATLNSKCLISSEALDGSGPTADYNGGKVGFCCKNCLGKWNAMDEAGKKAAFDKNKG